LVAQRVTSTTVRCRRVREKDRSKFQQDYIFTTNRTITQRRLAEQHDAILWIPELTDEIWSCLEKGPTLGSVAHVGQGLSLVGSDSLAPGAKTIEKEAFPGSISGFATVRGRWQFHQQPPLSHFNLSEGMIARPRSGEPTGSPQVLTGRNPMRGVWRLKPFIDYSGRPIASNFITVRQLPAGRNYPFEYFWALLCSPVANAYLYTHTLKRNIHDADLRAMPVPPDHATGIRRVAKLAREYLDAAGRERADLFHQGDVGEEALQVMLLRVDAAVLRLYGLPPRAERKLLNLFGEERRPGVPGTFPGYYPRQFKGMLPLYAYLSDVFQRVARGESPCLPGHQQRHYDELMLKRRDSQTLTVDEEDDLYYLQGEVDGRDYATRMPDNSWLDNIEKQQSEARRRLGQMASEIAALAQRSEQPG
jgi:hypothetical protein